jgi:hypothetical protein
MGDGKRGKKDWDSIFPVFEKEKLNIKINDKLEISPFFLTRNRK